VECQNLCSLHLGVEDASRSLNDADGLVGDLDLEDLTSGVGDNSHHLQTNILGLHVENEGERKRLLLSRRDCGLVTDSAQVTDDAGGRVGVGGKGLQRLKVAAHECNLDGVLLVVRDVHHGLCRAAVDQLHSKDVGIGESGDHVGHKLDSGRAASIIVEGLDIDILLAGARTRATESFGDSKMLSWIELTESPCAKTETKRSARATRTEYWRATIVTECN
jgi:hypothetical protein